MRKPAPEIRDQLWFKAAPEVTNVVGLVVQRGARRQKGQTAKEALAEAIVELCKELYLAGLDRGYDMGAEVFGEEARP